MIFRTGALALAALLSVPCYGEAIYYGATPRRVEVNATAATLLKFESAPLSASCQPEGLNFDTLREDRLTIDETNNVRKHKTVDAPESQTSELRNFLRLRPARRNGDTACSFSLRDGNVVPVVFELVDGLARPLIEFSPLSSKFGLAENAYSAVDLFRGLVSGDSLGLQDISERSQRCVRRGHGERCLNYSYDTETAAYEVTYAGTNGAHTAYIIRARLQKDASFNQLADLKSKGGVIYYSLLLPQKEVYQRDELVTHYVIATYSVTKDDIKEVSP